MASPLSMILAGATAALVQGAPVTVPSGMAVRFHEMIRDDAGQGAVYRLRFVAPALAGDSPISIFWPPTWIRSARRLPFRQRTTVWRHRCAS